jgi:hypothetical protein
MFLRARNFLRRVLGYSGRYKNAQTILVLDAVGCWFYRVFRILKDGGECEDDGVRKDSDGIRFGCGASGSQWIFL